MNSWWLRYDVLLRQYHVLVSVVFSDAILSHNEIGVDNVVVHHISNDSLLRGSQWCSATFNSVFTEIATSDW